MYHTSSDNLSVCFRRLEKQIRGNRIKHCRILRGGSKGHVRGGGKFRKTYNLGEFFLIEIYISVYEGGDRHIASHESATPYTSGVNTYAFSQFKKNIIFYLILLRELSVFITLIIKC